MLQCPVCKKEMKTTTHQKAEIDYCYYCGGFWLDSSKVEALIAARIDAPGNAAFWEAIVPHGQPEFVDEGHRQCPHCQLQMDLVTYQDLKLDYCPSCVGMWFDYNELRSYIVLKRNLHAKVDSAPPPPPALVSEGSGSWADSACLCEGLELLFSVASCIFDAVKDIRVD